MITFLKVLFFVCWLLLTVGVLINLWREEGSSVGRKVLWTIGIVIFPILGAVLVLMFGVNKQEATN